MYLALIILPILGSIMSGFFGRKVGVSGSRLITCACIIITTILSMITFIEVGINNIPVTVHLFRWVDSESIHASWAFNFDSLTVSMLIPVLIVSSLVHVYSVGYMSHDPHNQRFFSYLSLFTFMMIILVTANNFLLMFVGWEGVGVCSYLLVSFWFTRIPANQSSLSAFLTNRVGDCFLTIGMFAMIWSFGNLNYYTVFSLSAYYSENIIIISGICLLIGAMAKSSQIGLHVWLPMAMEGPTPVSALIHAATMVTAGVYLLMRSSPLIEHSSVILLICLWVGAITTLFSSLIGLFQQDIKKVIAYSTMSQLGMMVIAVGLSSYNVALFHLVNHAFYKGLLFLGAGAVIHAVADNQDFRKYGGLKKYLPLSYSVMLIASLSLVAFPFMTGFYSKDFILESAYGQYNLNGISIYFIAVIGAIFTTLYSSKVLHLTFLTSPNGPIINYKSLSQGGKAAHEGDIFMSIPLITLAVFSIFFGYLTKDIFIGLGSDFFSDNGLFIHPLHEIMLDTEFFVPIFYKLIPFVLTVSVLLLYLVFAEFFPLFFISSKLSYLGYVLFSFLNQRFVMEMYYNKYISGIILKLGGQTSKKMDKGVVERFGPHGLERKGTNMSKSINNLSTGVVTSYALYILVSLLIFVSILSIYYIKDSFQYLGILFVTVPISYISYRVSSRNLISLTKAEFMPVLLSVYSVSSGIVGDIITGIGEEVIKHGTDILAGAGIGVAGLIGWKICGGTLGISPDIPLEIMYPEAKVKPKTINKFVKHEKFVKEKKGDIDRDQFLIVDEDPTDNMQLYPQEHAITLGTNAHIHFVRGRDGVILTSHFAPVAQEEIRAFMVTNDLYIRANERGVDMIYDLAEHYNTAEFDHIIHAYNNRILDHICLLRKMETFLLSQGLLPEGRRRLYKYEEL